MKPSRKALKDIKNFVKDMRKKKKAPEPRGGELNVRGMKVRQHMFIGQNGNTETAGEEHHWYVTALSSTRPTS